MRTVRWIKGKIGPGIDQLREFRKDVRHFVAPLPAPDVDDDLGVRPLGKRLFGDSLPGPEAARDHCRPAFCHREHAVENPLPGNERQDRIELLFVGRGIRTGQCVHHGEFDRVIESADDLIDRECHLHGSP